MIMKASTPSLAVALALAAVSAVTMTASTFAQEAEPVHGSPQFEQSVSTEDRELLRAFRETMKAEREQYREEHQAEREAKRSEFKAEIERAKAACEDVEDLRECVKEETADFREAHQAEREAKMEEIKAEIRTRVEAFCAEQEDPESCVERISNHLEQHQERRQERRGERREKRRGERGQGSDQQ